MILIRFLATAVSEFVTIYDLQTCIVNSTNYFRIHYKLVINSTGDQTVFHNTMFRHSLTINIFSKAEDACEIKGKNSKFKILTLCGVSSPLLLMSHVMSVSPRLFSDSTSIFRFAVSSKNRFISSEFSEINLLRLELSVCSDANS